MSLTKILDLENDGLNMAAKGHYLYCLSKRGILKEAQKLLSPLLYLKLKIKAALAATFVEGERLWN